MATFVLVHGGWRGSFGFRHVRRALQQAGHDATAPSLTGLGERAHLASPQVTLRTHVQDVVNHILYEGLDELVLVGYSYGGAIVTACLDHIHGRVRELVFLDAFVPDGGESLGDLLGLPRLPITLGQEHYLPGLPREFDDPEEAAFQQERALPHPLATVYDAIALHQPVEDFPFGRTYVKATKSDIDELGEKCFREAAERARTSDRWRYREIDTNHMMLANRPEEVTALLLEVSASTPTA
jgi:pimeloyl-ACP methyl ester carboxylesterase